jgi:lipoic acid synthetase
MKQDINILAEIKPYNKKEYLKTKDLIEKNNLTTVCIEANCPNRYECFSKGTATFMILGNTCTRNCLYCNIKCGKPLAVDKKEPRKIAEAIKMLGINYAVITCVTRDDLKDGGASHFVKTINIIRKINPNCKVEILISDLNGNWAALQKIVKSKPDVINHNIETIKELFPKLRPQGDYNKSLELLRKIKEFNPKIKIKSGFMAGLGETKQQLISTMKDLKKAGCNILTIGQYLQPSPKHAKIIKYYTSKEFGELRKIGLSLGFNNIISGSLVRSSYHAENAFK